jgi:DNA-binding response OmpR family regulator
MLPQIVEDESSFDTFRAEHRVQVGNIAIDRLSQTVSVAGRPVSLTAREFALLGYLLDHPGLLLTRARLVGSVWGPSYGGSARTVDIHVARLRRKLGAGLSLTTLRRAGYRFELPGAAAPQPNGALE